MYMPEHFKETDPKQMEALIRYYHPRALKSFSNLLELGNAI